MTPPGTRAWSCFEVLDPLEMFEARRRLADHEPRLDLAELDDDDVLARLRDRREHDEELERRVRLRDTATPRGPIGFATAIDLRSLIERHDVAFLVLDGLAEPFPGIPYDLREHTDSLLRASSGNDGMVRRSGVTHDDYTLVLIDIEEVRWVRGAPGAGEHDIEIACCGIADGTKLEVLIFEELREHDDEQLTKLEATVQGDHARVSWTVTHDELAAIADDDARVSLVAEVRGPQQRWRKTDAQLELAVPCVLALSLGDAPTIDTAIELTVRTRGVADGVAVSFELWLAQLGAGPERLTTIEGIAVQGDRAATSWTLAPAADDPLRAHGGECWLVAKLDAPGAPTGASSLVFVAPP